MKITNNIEAAQKAINKDVTVDALSLVGESVYCLYVEKNGEISVEAMTVDTFHQLGSECRLTAVNKRKITECLSYPRIMNDPYTICHISDFDKWSHNVVCCYTSGRDCYDSVNDDQTMVCSVFYSLSLAKIKETLINL